MMDEFERLFGKFSALSRYMLCCLGDYSNVKINSVDAVELKDKATAICIKNHIHFRDGATKFVIVSDDSDYVYKIPRLDEEYDYCRKEVEVYEAACRDGFEQFVAPTSFIGTYSFETDGYGTYELPIYMMEKCKCYEEGEIDELWEYSSQATSPDYSEDSDELLSGTELVDDVFRNLYGDEGRRFMDWFYGTMDLNDLHDGNVGWNKMGRLVAIDYSGY